MKQSPPFDPTALRSRLAADIAAGRTISLSAEDLAHPEVRSQLPQLLEELTGREGPPPPLRVPGYTLQAEIGHGGMSTVWLARHETLQRPVALKIAPKWLAGDKRTRQRLLQEARAMARVPHPHIVAIHDILDVDDTVAIAMDWIDGRTLGELLAVLPPQASEHDLQRLRESLGTPPEAPPFAANTLQFFVRAIRDVAQAAHHVHAAGLLHLDVKPSNILVRRDGTALLSDFGVVRDMALDATHTRTFAGTPVYAAPEQLQRQDAAFGPHTDVYALGMTLYELLARQQPLRQFDLTRVVRTVLGGQVPPLGALAPIAPDLATIVHKAIAPEPGNRYATAAALADDLTAFLEHRPVSARPLSRWQRLRRWARVEPWKATLAAVLAVLLPGLAALAVYVGVTLPVIEEARLENRRVDAMRRKQAAFQAYFVGLSSPRHAVQLLREAMTLDPGPGSLACLLAILHDEAQPEARTLLAANDALVTAHAGLTLLATKVHAGRSYFTADEVTTLRESTSPLDKQVLALDRLLYADDADTEEAYDRAERTLEEAALMANGDSLMLGLRLWAASRADNSERTATITRSIRTLWSDDPAMLSWLYYSQEPLDPGLARPIAEELCRRHPHDPTGWEMLTGEPLRRHPPDPGAALQQYEAAVAAGVRSPMLETFHWMARSARDGKEAAAEALRALNDTTLTDSRRLRLLSKGDPAAAAQHRETLLRAADPSPASLEVVYRSAMAEKATEQAQRAWQAWTERFPDRRGLYLDRIRDLWNEDDFAGATKLIATFEFPRRMPGINWRQVCSALVTTRDWPQLRHHATRWREFASTEFHREADYYVALADLRLGATREGIARITEIMLGPPTNLMWYAAAMTEDAWMRVQPDTPAALRNPAYALQQLPAIARLMRERRIPMGPWTCLVFAEVYFANGDAARAKELAQRGLTAKAPQLLEKEAPDGIEDMLRTALARYEK